MADLRTALILDLRGNLARGLQRTQRQFEQTSRIGRTSMARLTRASNVLGRGLDRLGNRYTAIAGGAGAAATARFLVTNQRRMTRLGIDANASAEKIEALRDRLYDIARAPDIRADPSEIIAAIEAITTKTGDLEFAERNLKSIAATIQASGASGGAVGDFFAELQKLKIGKASAVTEAVDTLVQQGKQGSFVLRDLASLGPRVVTAYAGAVKGGRDSAVMLREMGAALQVVRDATGSSEQAATAFERLLSELQSPEKIKKLKRLGIQIFVPGSNEVLRPINELMTEIAAATDGRRTILGQIFGEESIRAFNNFDPARLEELMRIQGDGAALMADSARAAKDFAGAMQSLSNAWTSFADTNLTSTIASIADTLNSLDKETVDRWLKIGTIAAAGVGALLIGRGVFKGVRAVTGLFGGGKKAGSSAGGAMGGVPGVVPVYVVNKHLSLLPGAFGGGAAGGAAAGGAATAAGSASRAALIARRAGLLGASFAAGYGTGTVFRQLIDSALSKTVGRDASLGTAIYDLIETLRGDGIDAGAPPKAKLEIELTSERGARVRRLAGALPAWDVDVSSGPTMVTP